MYARLLFLLREGEGFSRQNFFLKIWLFGLCKESNNGYPFQSYIKCRVRREWTATVIIMTCRGLSTYRMEGSAENEIGVDTNIQKNSTSRRQFTWENVSLLGSIVVVLCTPFSMSRRLSFLVSFLCEESDL